MAANGIGSFSLRLRGAPGVTARLWNVVCVVSSAGHPPSPTWPPLDEAVALDDPPPVDPPLEDDELAGCWPDEVPLPFELPV
jgi:hypothetical protein